MTHASQPQGIAVGTVTEITAHDVLIRDEGDSLWRVPRARLPDTLRVGDRVILCALGGETAEREALARRKYA